MSISRKVNAHSRIILHELLLVHTGYKEVVEPESAYTDSSAPAVPSHGFVHDSGRLSLQLKRPLSCL